MPLDEWRDLGVAVVDYELAKLEREEAVENLKRANTKLETAKHWRKTMTLNEQIEQHLSKFGDYYYIGDGKYECRDTGHVGTFADIVGICCEESCSEIRSRRNQTSRIPRAEKRHTEAESLGWKSPLAFERKVA